MLVSVVIAPLSFCSFPPPITSARGDGFFLLSFQRTSSKTYHFFSCQINDFPIFMPVEIWCLPLQGSLCPSHFTSSWCLASGWGGGGTSRSPRGWQHWAGRHQRSWLEKPGAQEPAWFSLHSRDPWPSVSGLRPHWVNACSNTTPAGSRRFLVLQLNLRCHRYYFPPTTARTNICSVSAAHI